MSLGSSPLALSLIILATGLSAATLGILVSSIVKNENRAGGLTILIVLVLAVISGCINESVQIYGLNLLTPHYWARQGMLNVLQRDGTGKDHASRCNPTWHVCPILRHRRQALQVRITELRWCLNLDTPHKLLNQ